LTKKILDTIVISSGIQKVSGWKCVNGFHVLRARDIIYWLRCGFNLYEVEIGKEKLNCSEKVCVRKVRVIRKVKNYNKENLLKVVINPAVKRAKKAAYACAAADDAAYAADDAYAVANAAYAVACDAADAAADTDAAYDAERRLQTKDLCKLLK
jgi:hypothetical protein